MRFSSLFLALPLVGSFVAALPAPEPVTAAVAAPVFDFVPRVILSSEEHDFLAKRELATANNTDIVKIVQEVVDAILSRIPSHPLSVSADIEAVLNGIVDELDKGLGRLGNNTLFTHLEHGVDKVLANILGQGIAAVTVATTGININALSWVNTSLLNKLVKAVVDKGFAFAEIIEKHVPGVANEVNGRVAVLKNVINSAINKLKSLIGETIGSIPGVKTIWHWIHG